MDEKIEQPTPGRIVNFYPNGQKCFNDVSNHVNGYLPAIVTQSWLEGEHDTSINLTVFLLGGGTLGIFSVFHASQKQDGYGYWDWPQKK